MRRRWIGVGAVLLALTAVLLSVPHGTADDHKTPPAEMPPRPDQIQPKWKAGDKWVVETVSDAVQTGVSDPGKTKPVQWQFTVQKPEKVDDAEMVKLSVQSQLPGQQPQTQLWLDPKTFALRQVQTQVPVAGELRTLSEKYDHAQDRPAPVFVPISAVPLDIPAFLEMPGTKGVADFSYTASQPPPPGIKAASKVEFEFRVSQKTRAATAEELKKWVAPNLKKDAKAVPVVIELTTGRRTVTQLWQADQPWPVYSTNGKTESRLIEVTRVK